MESLILTALVKKIQQVQHIIAATGMAASGFHLGRAVAPGASHVQGAARALPAAGAAVNHVYSSTPWPSQNAFPSSSSTASSSSAGSGGGGRRGYSSAAKHQQQQRLPGRQGRHLASAAGRSGASGQQWSSRGSSGGRQLQQQQQSFSSSAATAGAAAPSAAADGVVEPGRLVEFKRGSDHFLGLVVKPGSKSNWMVEDAAGTLFSVGSKDVSCVLPGGHYGPDDLAAVAQQVATLADPSLLQLAWEISEASALYTVPEMADFIFGERSAASCAAAHRLLRDDRVYFKHAGRTPPVFSPRPPDQVEALQRQAAAEAKEAAHWAVFVADIGAAQKLPRAQKPGAGQWESGQHAERIALLRGYATGEASDGEKAKAIKTLNELHMAPTPAAAAEVLQGIGYWPAHVQLSLLTSGITEAFRPDLEELAQRLLESPPPDPDAATRRDLTGMTVFTIDDASTTEIDDGLSVERLPSGETKLWVHVADPTRWVSPGDLLDLEARRRTTSLYLPTGMISMFPKRLAEGPFSLRQGEACCALSIGLVLGPEGEVLPDRVEVVPTTVIPTLRLTYDSADELYAECSPQEEPDVFALLQAAELRREHRMDRGATEINMPECAITVDDPTAEAPKVELRKEEPSLSLSRQVVAEMMILAGEALGLLGARLRVALPYRGQPEPMLPEQEELDTVPEGPCQAVLLRNCMLRSVTLTGAPVRHAGLGLEAYVQVTSPIRRYGDLLAHWQVKAALRGEAAPFDADTLAMMMDGVSQMQQKVSKLERECESYWTAHYFLQHNRANPRSIWHAMFLCWFKQDAGLARVLLPHVGLETIVRVTRGGAGPGTRFFVRCAHAEPRLGVFRLDEVPDSWADDHDVVGVPEGWDPLESKSVYAQLAG